MSTIQDLLDHINEVGSTLGHGLVGQRLRDYGQQFSANTQRQLPMLKPKPTIEDLVNSGFNVGGVGAIKGKFTRPSMEDIGSGLWDTSKVWWHGGPNKVNPGEERLPFFTTDDPEYIPSSGYVHAYLSKKLSNSKLLDSLGDTHTTQPFHDVLKRAGYKYEHFPGSDSIIGEPIPYGRGSVVNEYLPDTVYHPLVQDQLRKEGYSGVRLMDHQAMEDTPVETWIDKPDLLPLGRVKIDGEDDLEDILAKFKKDTGFK